MNNFRKMFDDIQNANESQNQPVNLKDLEEGDEITDGKIKGDYQSHSRGLKGYVVETRSGLIIKTDLQGNLPSAWKKTGKNRLKKVNESATTQSEDKAQQALKKMQETVDVAFHKASIIRSAIDGFGSAIKDLDALHNEVFGNDRSNPAARPMSMAIQNMRKPLNMINGWTDLMENINHLQNNIKKVKK